MNSRVLIECAHCGKKKMAYRSHYPKEKRYCNSTCFNQAMKKKRKWISAKKLWIRTTVHDRDGFERGQ